jgi:hypothetical protein
MSYIILDIDNTIANDAWRIPKIDWEHDDPFQRYHRYHSLSPFDEAGNHDLFEDTLHDIIILTARPVHYYAQTEEWLLRNGVDFSVLLMRDTGDHCHSRELKCRQLRSLETMIGVEPKDIICAYDDRQDVVDMYRALGVNAVVRSIHDVCAYTPPKGIA